MSSRRSGICAAALAALLAVVPACPSPASKKVAVYGGATAAVLGGIMLLSSTSGGDSGELDVSGLTAARYGFWLGSAGVVAFFTGVLSNPRPDPLEHERALVAAGTVAPLESRPLPDGAADDRSIQLARQARAAALRYECAVVHVNLDELAARDRLYADAVIAGGVVAPCRGNPAPPSRVVTPVW